MEKLIMGLCYILGIMLFCTMFIYSLNKELERDLISKDNQIEYIENNKQRGDFNVRWYSKWSWLFRDN